MTYPASICSLRGALIPHSAKYTLDIDASYVSNLGYRGIPEPQTLVRQSEGAQGRLSAALEYLDLVPGEATSATAELRDRICRSGAHDLPACAPPSPNAGACYCSSVTAACGAALAPTGSMRHLPAGAAASRIKLPGSALFLGLSMAVTAG